MLGISAATLAVDPEVLLWTPEKKTIFIPTQVVPDYGLGDGIRFMTTKGFVDGPALISMLELVGDGRAPRQDVDVIRNGVDPYPLLSFALHPLARLAWVAVPDCQIVVPEGERVSFRNAHGLRPEMYYERIQR